MLNESYKMFYNQGCYFIPVDDKKTAFIGGNRWGSSRATRNPNLLKEWTGSGFGLAVVGGKIEGSDKWLVIVDADVKKENGLETLEKLQVDYGKLPKTIEVKTPSGGKHFYFLSDKPIGMQNDAFRNIFGQPSGLDIKGQMGYCCCPPTTNYEVITTKETFAELSNDWTMFLSSMVGARSKYKMSDNSEFFSMPAGYVDQVMWANKHMSVQDALEENGYIRTGTNVYKHPFGATSDHNVHVLPNESKLKHGAKYISWHYGAHDSIQGGPHDTFDILRLLCFDGDRNATIKHVKDLMQKEFNEELIATKSEIIRANEVDRPCRLELISHHWRVNDVVILGGDSETYKTFFILDAAFSAATGLDFLGRFKVRKHQSLLILTESRNDFYDRREAWVRDRSERYNIRREDIFSDLRNVYCYFKPLNIANEKSLEAFERLADHFGSDFQPKTWYIDHLSSNWGGKDENSSAEMAPYLEKLRQKATKDDIAFVIIHHPSKGGEKLRGSAVLRNNIPVAYNFEYRDKTNARVVSQLKCSYSNYFKSYALEPTIRDLYLDTGAVEANQPRTGLSIIAVDPPIDEDGGAVKLGRPIKVADQDVFDFVGDYSATTSDIAESLGVTPKTLIKKLKVMEGKGLIKKNCNEYSDASWSKV